MPISRRSTFPDRPLRRSRTVAALTAAATVAGLGIGVPVLVDSNSAVASSSTSAMPWLDTNKPVSMRVDALLNAMTLPEKVGQMDQQLVTTLTDTNSATCGDNGWNMPNP